MSPAEIFSAAPIFPSLARRSIVVTYHEIVDSAYNLRHCEGAERRAYDDIEGLVREIEAASQPDLSMLTVANRALRGFLIA